MNVKDLIKQLEGLPQDAEVVVLYDNGCGTCGGESMDVAYGIGEAVFREALGYPNDQKNVVVLKQEGQYV